MRLASLKFLKQGSGFRAYRRVYEGIQLRQTLWIVEDETGKLFAIDAAIGSNNFLAEFVDDGIVSGAAGLQNFMAKLIGPDQKAAELRQNMSHESFAASKTARQAHTQHG